MNDVQPLGDAGLLLLRPQAFGDARGWFMEGWNRDGYREAGIREEFVQFNVSRSAKGVIRGLHYQEPKPQGKLVMVLEGCVTDVAVDIRVGSPTFGQWWKWQLDSAKHEQLWVPPGFAHGFEVLSEHAVFAYLVTEFYHPGLDRAIHFQDPALGIDWATQAPEVSPRDADAPTLDQAVSLPSYGLAKRRV